MKYIKKYKIIIICCLVACVSSVATYFVFRTKPETPKPDTRYMEISITPFKDIKKEDIEKVVMCEGWRQAEVYESEMDEFISLVREIRIGERSDDIVRDGFSRTRIRVYYKDGTVQRLSPNGDLFDVDMKTYETQYGPSDKLGDMWWRILKQRGELVKDDIN